MSAVTRPLFERLNDNRFQQFGQSATLAIDDQAASVQWPVSVIVVEAGTASEVMDFGSSLAQISTLIHVRAAEIDLIAGVPVQLQRGCQITLSDGRVFSTLDQPLRSDNRRLNWLIRVKEVS